MTQTLKLVEAYESLKLSTKRPIAFLKWSMLTCFISVSYVGTISGSLSAAAAAASFPVSSVAAAAASPAAAAPAPSAAAGSSAVLPSSVLASSVFPSSESLVMWGREFQCMSRRLARFG